MNGELWALSSSLFYSLGNVTLRRGQQRRPYDSGVFVTTCVALVTSGAATAWELRHGRLAPVTPAGLFWLAAQGLITAYGARTLYYRTIRRLGPSRASLFKAVGPVFTLLISVPLLGERFALPQAAGIAAILVSMWLLALDAGQVERLTSLRPVAGGSGLAAAPRNRSRLPAGWLLGIVASCGFGLGYLLRKLAVTAVPDPMFATFVSSVVAMGGIFAVESREPQFGRMVRETLTGRSGWLYVSALFAAAALFASFSAFTRAPAALTAFLQGTQPLITAALGLVMLGRDERLRPLTVAALVVGVAGTVLLAMGGGR